MKTKILRIFAYGSWFSVFFVIGTYLFFPFEQLQGLIVDQIENALGKGKQGTYGVDPKLTVTSMSLAGFGVSAKDVKLQLASRNPDPGPTLEFETLKIGVSPFSLFGKTKSISVSADLYDGDADVDVTVDDKGNLYDADIDIDDIDLGKVPIIAAELGLPAAGKVRIKGKIELGAQPEKTGEGELKIELKGVGIGPGNLKLAAAFGGFEMPTVDLGSMTGKIIVKQGLGTLENMHLEGRDLQAELLGTITLRGNIGMSRLDVDGWFVPTPAFLEKNPKFQTLLQLGESFGGGASLGKAKDDEGHYYFSARGTLRTPQMSLARDNGKRTKSKAGKTTAAPAPPPPSAPTPPPAGDAADNGG